MHHLVFLLLFGHYEIYVWLGQVIDKPFLKQNLMQFGVNALAPFHLIQQLFGFLRCFTLEEGPENVE